MPLVAPGDLRPCNHMLLQRLLDLTARGALAKAKRGHIQRIEREAVAVRRVARRRAGAGIAWLVKIIDAGDPNRRLSGVERLHRFGNVEEHPMGKDALWRVGVIGDQRKALRVQWRAAP